MYGGIPRGVQGGMVYQGGIYQGVPRVVGEIPAYTPPRVVGGIPAYTPPGYTIGRHIGRRVHLPPWYVHLPPWVCTPLGIHYLGMYPSGYAPPGYVTPVTPGG